MSSKMSQVIMLFKRTERFLAIQSVYLFPEQPQTQPLVVYCRYHDARASLLRCEIDIAVLGNSASPSMKLRWNSGARGAEGGAFYRARGGRVV